MEIVDGRELCSCLGLGTTCCTGELHGAYYRVLGIHQLKSFEVQVAYCQGFAETQMVYVYYETLGYLFAQSLYLELAHRQCELTTGLNTFCMAFDLYRNLHNDRFARSYLHQVDVEQSIFYGLELQVFDYGSLFCLR